MHTTVTLDDLVYAYLERVEAGEGEREVMEELSLAHPEKAQALQRGVSLLRDIRLLPDPRPGEIPEAIGPFRLLRKLGQGGMGVVYVAKQESPNRRVALKLVRPDQLYFEGSRERFEREIESVARLSHSGIAAVLEMGEHDGVPWFSQELVIGVSLSELVSALPAHALESIRGPGVRAILADRLLVAGEELPESAWNEEFFSGSWVDISLRIARQVADALQHAHERGVLHRDVKPANVIITPGGRAVLVDFGLASLQGSHELTRTGTQLGSLNYMSPEQIDGQSRDLGPQSDVYSLGVTLFELLTLRAPFASQSVERLRGMILQGEAPNPRKLNGAVSKDAALVCVTAMEPGRERRYASARELSSDLAAVLAHRPISARSAGRWLRLVRWSQRHPARAIAAVAGLLLFVVAPTVFGLQRNAAARELSSTNRDLEDALAISQANLDGAIQAIERVMRMTALEGFDSVPGMLELRVDIIDEALLVFEPLQANSPDDEQLLAMKCRLLTTQGGALAELGQHDEAHAALARALALAEPRGAQDDAPVEWVSLLALAQARRSGTLVNQGRPAEAISSYRAAIKSARRAVHAVPESPKSIDLLANCISGLANALTSTGGDAGEVRRLVDETFELSARALVLEPDSMKTLRSRSSALRIRAGQRQDQGDLLGAEGDLQEAVLTMEHALSLDPQEWRVQWELSISLRRLGRLSMILDRDTSDCVAHLQRSLELLEALVDENPGVLEYEEGRNGTLMHLASVFRERGDHRGAYNAHLAVGWEFRRLARSQPGDFSAQINAAMGELNLANTALLDLGRGNARFELVLEHCDEAEALLDAIGPEYAGSQRVRENRALLHFERGAALFWLEDEDGLLAEIEAFQALELDEPMDRYRLAFLWSRVFELTGDSQWREESLGWLRLAVEDGFSDLGSLEQCGLIATLGGEDAAALGQIVRQRAAQD